MLRAVMGSVAILALVCGSSAADDTVEFKHLVGKWELVESKPGQTVTLEFTKEMKVVLSIAEQGRETRVDGTFKLLESNKMFVHLKFMNEEIKETLTVRKLTYEELVTDDSKGKTETMRRKK